ncbi:uncharacterized protein LOC117298754 [Asterias rubens]|uniref:uncharacterized protein LOC117298754 n=1 Tax=Asterias rubens TaxID=7604 RepID=UPI001455424A|nr:uncharacterized protein LOC117298754 [Asterias rubens]
MTLRFNNGGFTIVEKLFQALREILQHWRLSLASLLFYILLSLLTNVCRENLLVLASTSNTCSTQSSYHTLTEQNCPEASQCHTLGNLSHAESICNLSVRCRTQTNLEFNLGGVCSWRKRSNLVQLGNSESDCLSMPDAGDCTKCLEDFIIGSREVEDNFEEYSSILRRYDCDRNYSMWGCDQCKVAAEFDPTITIRVRGHLGIVQG